MRKAIATAILLLAAVSLGAKQYYGSYFGMKSDGVTNNTTSLQNAVDWISKNSPGDTLTLWVGRYLTGTVYLKSNVTIQLREGAVLVGVPSAHDYYSDGAASAILVADGQENIHLFGLGVIDGNSSRLLPSINEQKDRGYLQEGWCDPALVYFKDCRNVSLSGLLLINQCAREEVIFTGCTDAVFNPAKKL